MTVRRPTLLISNVLPKRPGDAAYDAYVDRLWASLEAAASPHFRVVREYAQLDGPHLAVSRALDADAVVLMGGEDLDPALYGGPGGYTDEGHHFTRADLAHTAIVRAAVAHRVPLLGICRGMQAINVAMGGTLVQHMENPGHLNPTIVRDHVFARHSVHIDPTSDLARALGPLAALDVSSAHHQCVARPGLDLRVVARALDGTVEAVEHADAPVIGVQWHPEDPMADPRPLSALLGFLDAALARRLVLTTRARQLTHAA